MTTSYPLAWPDGWPRTKPSAQRAGKIFKTGKDSRGWLQPVTFAVARDKLFDEVERLGATNIVLSTNFPINHRGLVMESSKVADHGIAIYFTYLGKAMVMACDRYDTAAGNMSSLRLAIEALRQLERHGGGYMMQRAFSGFAALPPPGAKPWRHVLKVDDPVTRDKISAAYRTAAARRHPDAGGSTDLMAELNEARDAALKEVA